MNKDPFLLSLRDLEIALPPDGEGVVHRVRITVRVIASRDESGETSFDLSEVADIVRSHSEIAFTSFHKTVFEIRDEVKEIPDVISCVVSLRDVDTHDDAESVHVSTLPDPKHAVLYGVLP